MKTKDFFFPDSLGQKRECTLYAGAQYTQQNTVSCEYLSLLCRNSSVSWEKGCHVLLAVSMPREKEVTSRSSRSCTVSDLSARRLAACAALPYITASSGLMASSSCPFKTSFSNFSKFGI